MATIPYANDSTKFFLYAINILLHSIGEPPLEDDADYASIIEAQIAANVLEETKQEVLAEGWDCNTDIDWEFAPDINGKIAIPANIMELSDKAGRYYMRDWLLYDKQNQTFIFDKPVKCDVVWNLEFNALPHSIRYYITLKASRTFQYRTVGDAKQFQFSQDDLERAYISARRSDGFTAKYNIKTSPYGQQFTRLK